MISQGNREKLIIDFDKKFNCKIEAIKAADEENFESYLCVLPANVLSQLYKRYSSRLLEKNVRSFLQFRNKSVNAGMKKTLTKSPEKFIENKEDNFELLNGNVIIHSKTADFYKKIESILWGKLPKIDKTRLTRIIALIQQEDELSEELISFEESLIQKIRINYPETFDKIDSNHNTLLEDTYNYIIKKYNSSINTSENIISVFEKIEKIASIKGVKFTSSFIEIGKKLNEGLPPTIKQIYYASYYILNKKEKIVQ